MVQESTMICVDNSEWMRNGDFVPTRLQSQQDAANLVAQCKLRANPENAVGLLAMADTVTVLSTMTQESGRLFMKLHNVEPNGKCQFLSAIKVAHLALKHRQNRNHKMRVVLFIGSPIEDVESTELTSVAKKLKKEKVMCDVVCFGESDSNNAEIMGKFVDTLNGKDGSGSNMISVPAGSSLTEALIASAVCRGEDGGNAPVGVAVPGGGFEFGVDPEDDPDLALALRVSMEEERARQMASQAGGAEAPSGPAVAAPAAPAGGAAAAEALPDVMDMEVGTMSEEQQLEWALRMSMFSGEPAPTGATTAPAADAAAAPEAAPAAASQETPMDVDPTAQMMELMDNPDLLQQIVDDLPGGASQAKKEEPSKEEKK